MPRVKKSKRQTHIGFVLFDPRYSFFWSLTANCLLTEAARRGVRLTTVPVNLVTDQVAVLEQLLAQQVDALLVKPMAMLNDSALAALVRKATTANVPVIALDSTIAEESLTCTIGSDNAKAQALVAEHVFKYLNGQGKVAYLQGDLRIQAGALRTQGFQDTLRRYSNIELGYEAMLDWRAPTSRTLEGASHMRQALARHPDLRAVICSTDEAALGAMEVIAEAGLKEQIVVAGFDGIPEALLAIYEGRMLVTLKQAPRDIARHTLDVALDALNADKPTNTIITETALVTSDNVLKASIDSLQMIPGMVRNLIQSQQDPEYGIKRNAA